MIDQMQIIDTANSNTASALEIQQNLDEIKGFVADRLNKIYQIVNTPGREQAILNRIGNNAAEALSAYVLGQQWLEMLSPGSVPPADTEKFVANEDGTVTFVEDELP